MTFRRKAGIKAEGLFSDREWWGRAEEGMKEIISQILGDTDIHILERRPHLLFTNHVSQLAGEEAGLVCTYLMVRTPP